MRPILSLLDNKRRLLTKGIQSILRFTPMSAMKTLFRIFAVLFVLLLVVSAAGYFILTNAGVQKRLLEAKLPAGSSIERVHVTTGQLQLNGLVLRLPDGTCVKLGSLDTVFDPLAAVFKQTIKLGALQIQDLQVDLTDAAGQTAVPFTQRQRAPTATPVESAASDTVVAERSDPMEALYALSNFEWLLEVERIALNGEINDGKGTRYVVTVDSAAIHPGQQSTVEACLRLDSDQPLPSGLKAFDSKALLRFTQKATGGFESLRLESQTSGTDAQGGNLISVNQAFDLAVQQAEGLATLSAVFDADLPRPELLAPELAALGAVRMEGQAVASTDGAAMTLSSADLKVFAGGAQVLALDLKQRMRFGSAQNLSGELLQVTLTELPLAWLNPWLGQGMLVDGAPVSLVCSISGTPESAFAVRFPGSIHLGPLSVRDAEALLLEDISCTLDPELQWDADQSVAYTLKSLSLSDKYGSFLTGSSTGLVLSADARNAQNPFAGFESRTQLQVGLQELFQLPVLDGQASIVGGQLSLNVNVDGAADFPLQVEADVSRLRARSMPETSEDYHLALQLKQAANAGEWAVGADLQVGSISRPSTSLQFSGKANPQQQPLTFTAALSGQRVSQADFSILSAAFTPRDMPASTTTASVRDVVPTRVAAGPTAVVSAPVPPPWALVDGIASVNIDELRLESGPLIQALEAQASVSELQLVVSALSAKLGAGELHGRGEVLYTPANPNAYNLSAGLDFTGVDPAFFASKGGGAAPLQGQFDGSITLRGAGQTLDAAVEDSEASLRITGKEGILTAFELDNRSQLGLGLVGLLGQSLERPRMTALSKTIPYFKDIRFDHFALELTRGADKRVLIPELKLTGESLLLDASGSVAASRWSEVMDQPLNLSLSLGAKGKLMDYLQTLHLLQATAAEDGFRRWNQDVQLTGSLANPNTDALMELLNSAARSALTTSQPAAQPESGKSVAERAPTTADEAVQAPQPRSKAERRRDDIEMGLDLLNSIFGK